MNRSSVEARGFQRRIFLALDFDNAAAALRLVDELGDSAPCYKVGMELYYRTGPAIVEALHERGRDVFVDLKMYDIPNTVAGAARSLAHLGVHLFNVHVAGGTEMMRRAREASDRVAEMQGSVRPLVIGVTQVTSSSQSMMNDEIGIPGSVSDCVRRYASMAQQAGLDGVVTSALELPVIRQVCGDDFLTVVPGIRPAGSSLNDQVRVATPQSAFQAGAGYLVVGRPVTSHAQPRQAWQELLQSLSTTQEG